MNDYPFVFSVVMSVYNVQAYIREAIRSLEKQSIGFRHIQLILVDDGSTDSSGAICDEYAKRYPENVMVIHKENGGLSSARNVGLQHIRGELVNFLDPDDKLDHDVMAKVKRFMDAHGDVDLCCIPIEFFGHMSGPHPLNNKFEKGTRVIDLMDDENADCFLFSMASGFYRNGFIRDVRFNTEIYTAEDALENMRLQIKQPKIGAVSDCVYHYRKHGNSTLDHARFRHGWYLTYLRLFAKPILDLAEKEYSGIPKFVQHAIMYDLQWKINQSHIQPGILTEEESQAYRELLFQTACRIDDDVIWAQKSMSADRKLYVLQHKYASEPDKVLVPAFLEVLPTGLNKITVSGDSLLIDGYQTLMNGMDYEPQFEVMVNGTFAIRCGPVRMKDQLFCVDIPYAIRIHFHVKVPLNKLSMKSDNIFQFNTLYDRCRIRQKNIRTGQFSPISSDLSKSWFVQQGYLVRPAEGGFTVRWLGRHHAFSDLKREMAFLLQIARDNRTGAKKAVFGRLLYHLEKPFAPNNIWLVTDRADRADDNGEAFYRYLLSLGKSSVCTPVFAIGKDSPDYKRMKLMGRVVPYMSWRYKLMHLLAKHTISAYSHNEISSPFQNYSRYYGDLMQNNKVIFLQHGITKDDVSSALNYSRKNYALFVTSTKVERESILNGNYGYSTEQVILTGMPRYDRLYDNSKKTITIMPTWSRSLCGKFIAEESRWELLPGFEQSEYYQFYSALLNHQKLLSQADDLGYTIRFLIHPVFLPYVDRFKPDRRVVVLHGDARYRDVFAESALIVTDYSSVAFDFAYLNKPVVYTQFESNHYEEGYFDYERDGFGEVEHTLEGTVDRLIEYMENGCQLKPMYRERIDRFFQFHDKNNCERVYKAILALDEEQT